MIGALAVTFFNDHAAQEKRQESLTVEMLAEVIRATSAPEKVRLPWLKLARFGSARTEKGSLRHDRNIIACSGIEADYDGEKIGFEQAVEILEKAGVEAIVYTSPSHAEERPRWRVICPFSTELPPDRRQHMLGRLNGLFRGVFACESWTLSQSYYYGSVNGNPTHRVEIVQGMPIDRCDEFDEIWQGKPDTLDRHGKGNGNFASGPADEDALLSAIVSGESYHVASTRLVGKWAQQGIPFLDAQKRIEAAFDQVEASGRDTRWQQRRGDVPRIVRDIYGKEAEQRDARSSGAIDPRSPYNGSSHDEVPLGHILQITDTAWKPDQLPPRPWIAPPYILRKHITLPHGPGGVGKSLLIDAWACALALGQNYGRLRPVKRCRVLLANFEDDEEEQLLRLSAALKYFKGNPTPQDLEGYLYRVTIAEDADATMFELDRVGAVRPTRTFEALDMWCRELHPHVTALDTLVAINAVPEDNNILMRRVMATLRRLCRASEMALILTHHDRKAGGEDEDSDAANARGAGDIINAARFELAVKKMTSDEAKRFNLDPKDRASYFRLGSLGSKLNYIAADEAEWFERVTHVIGGSPVSACIPWMPPDAFDGVTKDIANAILDDIDAGLSNGVRYSDANAAKARAASKVVLKHLSDKTPAEAQRIINKWVRNDVLVSEEYFNEERHEKEHGLRVNPGKRP